jgi:methylmalonyl-CoA mutase N-terminal domain/subunit
VNKFTAEEKPMGDLLTIDDSIRQTQIDKINAVKSSRNAAEVKSNLEAIERAARGDENLMPHILTAVESYATLGEIADVMRGVYGEFR